MNYIEALTDGSNSAINAHNESILRIGETRIKEEQNKIDEEKRKEAELRRKEVQNIKERERRKESTVDEKEKKKVEEVKKEVERELEEKEEENKEIGKDTNYLRMKNSRAAEYQRESLGRLEEEEDVSSLLSSTTSSRNTKSFRSTSVPTNRKIGMRSRRPSISESEYGDCQDEIENNNEERNGNENINENENENNLDVLSECSDDSFLSANEDFPETENYLSELGPSESRINSLSMRSGTGITDSALTTRNIGGDRIKIKNKNKNEIEGDNESKNENEDENEIEKAENLSNLIKQTEAVQGRLMSDIRLIGNNNDETKNILLRLLENDLIECENDLYNLKINYVEQLIVVDNEKSKLRNKMRSIGALGYENEEVEDEGEKRDLTGATASTSLDAFFLFP